MLDNTCCEVCGKHDWQQLGQRRYRQADIPHQPAHVQARLRLLFQVWAREQAEFRISAILCKHCGFIIYLPRPQAADLEAKYRYQDPASASLAGHGYDHPVEIVRSRDVWRYLAHYCNLSEVSQVLDFGGMDGRLLHSFLDQGKACSVIDYCPTTAPGIRKLGDTLAEVEIETQFELIICSHVLEHVTDPRKIVQQLSQHLSADGHLFIEVPMEVWRRPPLPAEPVTHINFFTPNSLYNLLRLAGLELKDCQLTACAHPSGRRMHGIRAVATRPHQPEHKPQPPALRPPDAMHYIKPSLAALFAYYAIIPEKLPLSALRALRRRLLPN